MELVTKARGKITVTSEQLIDIPEGLFGFEKYTKYKIFIVIALTVIAALLFMLAGYRMSN